MSVSSCITKTPAKSFQKDMVVDAQRRQLLLKLPKLHRLTRDLAGVLAIAALITGIVSLTCVGSTLAIIAAGIAGVAFCLLLVTCVVKHCIWHLKATLTPVVETSCPVGNPYCDSWCRCQRYLIPIPNCSEAKSNIEADNSNAESIDLCKSTGKDSLDAPACSSLKVSSGSSTTSTYHTCDSLTP